MNPLEGCKVQYVVTKYDREHPEGVVQDPLFDTLEEAQRVAYQQVPAIGTKYFVEKVYLKEVSVTSKVREEVDLSEDISLNDL